jgi:hypothetical protein
MKKYIIITTISILVSSVVFSIGFITGDLNRRSLKSTENMSQDWTDVGGNIDIEYYLEVSQDSIWIENYSTHKVYGGKYSNLDSLINLDNL